MSNTSNICGAHFDVSDDGTYCPQCRAEEESKEVDMTTEDYEATIRVISKSNDDLMNRIKQIRKYAETVLHDSVNTQNKLPGWDEAVQTVCISVLRLSRKND